MIRSSQQAITNQWVTIWLEAVGPDIALFIDDRQSPVTVYHDVDPFLTGKAVLYHEDPFGVSLTTPADSSGTFFEYFQVDFSGDPVPEVPPTISSIEFHPRGGATVVFRAVPTGSYRVEASSDLDEWDFFARPHATDSDGRLTVEDASASDMRFWRFTRQ